MIPKKIHYCWFSGDPYPEIVQQCMASWHKYMPDWEYVLWDMDKIKDIDSVWLKECIEARKWAFAADFIRVYALYHEGGVYLDSDVEVYRDMSNLLCNQAFIGRENNVRIVGYDTCFYLTSHCMGAEAGNLFMKRCMHYYYDRHFIRSNDSTLPPILQYDRMIMPQIQCELAKEIGFDASAVNNKLQVLEGLVIFPNEYFDTQMPNVAYCKHWAVGGWLTKDERLREKKVTVKYWIYYHIYKYTYKWWLKHHFLLTPLR